LTNNVYGGFSQALFFSGSVSIPSLLLDHYVDLGMGHKEMLLLIHIMAETNGADPKSAESSIVKKMGISQVEFQDLLTSMQDKGLLLVNLKTNDKKSRNLPAYDFSGLIDQLFELWGINQFKQMEALEQSKEDTEVNGEFSPSLVKLTAVFEQELGRPLTGFECEHIEKWMLAKYSEELIIEALRRGVSAGIRNFRYLDSILREWEKKGIQTRLEVEAEDQNFQARQNKKTEKTKSAKPASKAKNKYDNIYL